MSNKEGLELTVRMVFAALSLQNNQKSEKTRSRELMKSIMTDIFETPNIEELIKEGESLHLMHDDEIEAVFSGNIYTSLKCEGKEEEKDQK